eukprot:CAMPEP_0181458118 /NCGR_PEP_ID=MMETSP1110-20121109/32144_1 /TAXON_ID=174948 /ORGANISM="Symbiodinium sp., Strain CCMP421" /LENGTH=72 /DNA_ID=CAMNT_0023582595 /DNA_START=14 /DNA_END=232 /DNA_ORIENTATION=-
MTAATTMPVVSWYPRRLTRIEEDQPLPTKVKPSLSQLVAERRPKRHQSRLTQALQWAQAMAELEALSKEAGE